MVCLEIWQRIAMADKQSSTALEKVWALQEKTGEAFKTYGMVSLGCGMRGYLRLKYLTHNFASGAAIPSLYLHPWHYR